MTDREKYLFDLQGFVVVKSFLGRDEVDRLNGAFDQNMERLEKDEEIGSYGSKVLEGEQRGVFNGMLTWPQPHCQPFRDLLAHKKLVPYLDDLLGRGWHSDSPPVAWHSTKGAEGLALHMGDPHFSG